MAEKKEATKKEEVKKAAPAAKPVAKAEPKTEKATPKATVKEAAPKAVKAESAPVKAEPKVAAKAPTPKAKKEKGKAPYVSSGEIRVELVHGIQGCTKRQIRTVQALGLGKIGSVKVHKDNPATNGMVKLVAHLVRVEKVKS